MNECSKIKFDDGKSLAVLNIIQESNYIVDIKISENKEVQIFLKLDNNYRKVKSLCESALQSQPWITSLDIKIAAKV
jgi:uncharacterized protein involved in tolerance to divalent cations